MDDFNRRSALALGIAASSAVIVNAAAQPYWSIQGREIAPGVRVVQAEGQIFDRSGKRLHLPLPRGPTASEAE